MGQLAAIASRACTSDPARHLAGSAPLLPGDEGTAQTVALIRRAYQDALTDPLVRSTAGTLVRALNPTDLEGQARAIFEWVRKNIRFVRDPVGHEVVSSAQFTLTRRFGDCDDVNAVLLPALLGAVGIHTRLVTVAGERGDPQFTHIYCEAAVGGIHAVNGWVPLDMARPGATFGTTGQGYSRKRIWEIEEDSYRDIAGLGSLGFSMEDLVSVIGAGTGAATNIISSLRVPAQNMYYRTPTTTVAQASYPGGSASFSQFGIGQTELLFFGGILAIILFTRK